MVKATSIFSALAVFIAAAAASIVSPDRAWQVIDTHSAQLECLMATNRKCNVIDIAEVTQQSLILVEALGAHLNTNGYTAAQWKTDTDVIAADWKHTADFLTVSFPPLNEIHGFYQRMAAADMLHWTQYLPLFTIFHRVADDPSKGLLDLEIIHAGIQAIYTQSDVLAEAAFNYLPAEPPIIPEQIGNIRQRLTDEPVEMLDKFLSP